MRYSARQLVFCILVVSLQGCGYTISRELRHFGYSEIRPPSTLVDPGVIVSLKSRRPLELNIICNQRDSLGQPAVETSISQNVSLQRRLGGQLRLDASYYAEFAHVREVRLALTNVKLWALTTAEILRAVRNRSDACSQAIMAEIAYGRSVTGIKSAIMADVTYTVKLDTAVEVTLDARRSLLERLASHLGTDLSVTSERTLSGSRLFWGVIDDPLLVAPSAEGVTSHGRVLGAEAVAKVERGPTRQIMDVIPLGSAVDAEEWHALDELATSQSSAGWPDSVVLLSTAATWHEPGSVTDSVRLFLAERGLPPDQLTVDDALVLGSYLGESGAEAAPPVEKVTVIVVGPEPE